MISKLINLIPTKHIIFMWNNIPFPRWFRDFIIWRSNCRFLVAVLGIIQNDEGKILLLKHTYRKKPWALPSGWIEYEHPFKGLEREIYEETNFAVKAESILDAKHTAKPHRIDLIIKGRFLQGKFKESHEVSDYGFFDISELPKDMSDNQRRIIETMLN